MSEKARIDRLLQVQVLHNDAPVSGAMVTIEQQQQQPHRPASIGAGELTTEAYAHIPTGLILLVLQAPSSRKDAYMDS